MITVQCVLLMFATLFSVLVVTTRAQIDMDTVGKECTAAFHCWKTEPVTADGLPLSLSGRLSKRLDIGGALGRGNKCRCRQGFCQLYVIPTRAFVPCEEF
uniref:Secreted protein n=1 Tax=Steinernema glaseri TaxID=37863 RepID=A0A1I8A8P9_9BILA